MGKSVQASCVPRGQSGRLKVGWEKQRLGVFCLTALLVFVLCFVGYGGSGFAANPFETVPEGHWSYEAVRDLAQKGLFKSYLRDRLYDGYRFTHFDLALWMGDAVERMAGMYDAQNGRQDSYNGDSSPTDPAPTMRDLIDAFNSEVDAPLTETDINKFRALIDMVDEHMEFLGYMVPPDGLNGSPIDGSSVTSHPTVAAMFNAFRAQRNGDGDGSTTTSTVLNTARPGIDLNGEDTNAVRAHILPPLLTVEGEVQAKKPGGEPTALKATAQLQPLPVLALGASYMEAEGPPRFRISLEEEETSRLDLSAAVGQWILSLRRREVMRASDFDEDNTAVYTRLGLEYPLGERALIRAGREVEREKHLADGEESGMKTELDVEVSFDKGKVGLGFVLESVPEKALPGAEIPPLQTRASIEHQIGSIGTATAGISFGHLFSSTETSSNLGLRYDFPDASVSLNYRVFAGSDDTREVTTAEVSIKF